MVESTGCVDSGLPWHGIPLQIPILLCQLKNLRASVRSNNCLSYGLKSRPGNCPYTPVAQGSGVLVTGCRKFPAGKAAGRNASEPRCSLVIRDEDADPVDAWGRPRPEDLGNGSGPWDLPG
jgi:hypothetical protein